MDPSGILKHGRATVTEQLAALLEARYVFRCYGFPLEKKERSDTNSQTDLKSWQGIYSRREIEHKRFTKKQGVDYLSFLIDCQRWASLNSLYRRQIGPFTAYHEVNNILRWMVVITLREGDLLNPLPFSIIGCCFYAVLLYAANGIRRVIKAHQQDKFWKANCPNADLNLKKARASFCPSERIIFHFHSRGVGRSGVVSSAENCFVLTWWERYWLKYDMKKLRSQGRAFAAMIKCCVQVGPITNDFFPLSFSLLILLIYNAGQHVCSIFL